MRILRNVSIIIALMFVVGCSCEREVEEEGNRVAQRRSRASKKKREARKKVRALQDADENKLIAALRDKNEEVRAGSVRTLARRELKSQKVIEGVVPLLVDNSNAVRRNVIRLLVEIGEPAVPELLKAMRSDYPKANAKFERGDRRFSITHTINRTIKEIGKPTIAPLLETLKTSTDNDQKKNIASALSQFGEDAAEASPILLDGLKNEDEQYRRSMIWYLTKIAPKNDDVKKAFTKLAKDDENEKVRTAAENALKKIEETNATAANATKAPAAK